MAARFLCQSSVRPHVEATTRTRSGSAVSFASGTRRAKARDAALIAAQGGMVVTTVRQNMIPDLQSGFLDLRCQGAGSVFPQPTVRLAGQEQLVRLDDVTGSRFRVVTSETLSRQESAALNQQIGDLEGCMVCLNKVKPNSMTRAYDVSDEEGCLREWMTSVHARFVIVRPDHYVYATASSAEGALLSLQCLATDLRAA